MYKTDGLPSRSTKSESKNSQGQCTILTVTMCRQDPRGNNDSTLPSADCPSIVELLGLTRVKNWTNGFIG